MSRGVVQYFWLVAAACLGLSAPAYSFSLNAPRMVLNRSLFLSWDAHGGAGFQSYEVFASTQQGFSPSPASRVAVLATAYLSFARISRLAPSTRYFFVVRLNTTTGVVTSAEVSAVTLADGVNETSVPVMMYHHVQPRAQFPAGFDPGGWYSLENFTRDLDYFRAHGVNCVGYQEILDRIELGTPLPPNPVFLTFDDGFTTYIDHAVPALLARDYQSVNAIVTRRTGGTSQWAVPAWPLMPLMSWNQVRECQRQGMWMGSHTQTHVDLNLETNKWYEINGSRDDLVAQLAMEPRYFCYPWGMAGRRNQTVLNLVGNAGFTLATRTWPPAIATVTSEKLWFPRQFANQNDSLRDVLVKFNLETDKDGLRNWQELDWGLDAALPDTDGDGLSDGQEAGYDGQPGDYRPYHPSTNPTGTDCDARRPDSDLDGLLDGAEVNIHRTNPLRADSDGDGLTDGAEVSAHATNPLAGDTDGDGAPDGVEIARGSDPRVRGGIEPFRGTAPDLASWIEAEDFDYGGAGVAYSDATATNEGGRYRVFEGVDIAADTTASNGHVVGWTRAGEWLNYRIAPVGDATYTLQMRVAASGAGGRIRVLVDSVDVTGALVVPDTRGWSSWTLIEKKGIALGSGLHDVRVVLETAGSSGYVAAFDAFRLKTTPPAVQRPFNGTSSPWAMPGTFEAENFDEGGPDLAYSDTTAANEGGQYRVEDSVDIANDSSAGNGRVVGWTKAGEWMEYTVTIPAAGLYTLEARAAAVGTGGLFRIEVGGLDRTGSIALPNTGAWNAYQTVSRSGIALDTGIQTVRVVMVANGSSGYVGAFDWFRMATPPVQSPYPSGVPWPVPGRVEVEDFDRGGPDLAYQDLTPQNEGGQYRVSEGVDIANDAGAGNGRVVGWSKAGEWIEYTISVVSAGTYTVEARVAGLGSGGRFRLDVDGVDRTGPLNVPNTGAWNAYQLVQKTGVSLAAGIHTARVVMVSNGSSGFVAAMDWIRFAFESPPPPALARAAANPLAGILDVRTSDEQANPGAGWAAVDGDPKTVWTGVPGARGWWMAIVYDSKQMVRDVAIDWAPGSPTNVQILASLDASEWIPLRPSPANAPVAATYLWLMFPDLSVAPAIRDLNARPD